jgi:hypothetical protein
MAQTKAAGFVACGVVCYGLLKIFEEPETAEWHCYTLADRDLFKLKYTKRELRLFNRTTLAASYSLDKKPIAPTQAINCRDIEIYREDRDDKTWSTVLDHAEQTARTRCAKFLNVHPRLLIWDPAFAPPGKCLADEGCSTQTHLDQLQCKDMIVEAVFSGDEHLDRQRRSDLKQRGFAKADKRLKRSDINYDCVKGMMCKYLV